MLQLIGKFGVSEQNPCWIMVLTIVSGSNYALNEYEYSCEYGLYAIPSDIMPCCSCPTGWVDLFDKLTKLPC